MADHTVTVISKTGYHVPASHTLGPDYNNWRNHQTPRPLAGALCNQ